MTTSRPVDIAHSWRRVKAFRTKSAATSAAKTRTDGMIAVRVDNRFFRYWAAANVLRADDATARLRCLTDDGDTTIIDVIQNGNLVQCDVSAHLAAHTGMRVLLIDTAGDGIDATVVALDEARVVLRRHDRRERLTHRLIASIAVADGREHRTRTGQSSSGDRHWAVKPSGRALGWRPNQTCAWAACETCDWTAPAADRTEARSLARDHRMAAAPSVSMEAAG